MFLLRNRMPGKSKSTTELVKALRDLEQLLLSGTDYPSASDSLGVSPKQIQRYLSNLEELGLEVRRSRNGNARILKATRATRVFR